jgi:hypothetical protein
MTSAERLTAVRARQAHARDSGSAPTSTTSAERTLAIEAISASAANAIEHGPRSGFRHGSHTSRTRTPPSRLVLMRLREIPRRYGAGAITVTRWPARAQWAAN